MHRNENGFTFLECIIVVSIIAILAIMLGSIFYDASYRPKEAAEKPALSLDDLSSFTHLLNSVSFDDGYKVVKFSTNQQERHFTGKIWVTRDVYEWLHLDDDAYAHIKSHKGENLQTTLGYYKAEKERQRKAAGAAEK